jgi:hypothetical protein
MLSATRNANFSTKPSSNIRRRSGGALWVLWLPRVSGATVIWFLEPAEPRAAGMRPGTPRVSRRNMGKASH